MNRTRKLLFIDRDGTIIREPHDYQVDSLEKMRLMDSVIPALLALSDFGFELIMITNQDGLGTSSFPKEDFDPPHNAMMDILTSQGVVFKDILICPHLPSDKCLCRKPHLGLVRPFLVDDTIDLTNSYVIGDRDSDLQLAENMGITGLKIGLPGESELEWPEIVTRLTQTHRTASENRVTKETAIDVTVNLDSTASGAIHTGIGFFDHMLEQLGKHGGFSLDVAATGDLHIDEHHTVEDCGITIGSAVRKALGDKRGIQRYGFILPMDETESKISLDLSGRPYFVFKGELPRSNVGGLSSEMAIHFFRSFAEALGATLHMEVQGENAHHMIESLFKGLGRTLRDAISKTSTNDLPTTKGVL